MALVPRTGGGGVSYMQSHPLPLAAGCIALSANEP